jgi:hypothetical protein
MAEIALAWRAQLEFVPEPLDTRCQECGEVKIGIGRVVAGANFDPAPGAARDADKGGAIADGVGRVGGSP